MPLSEQEQKLLDEMERSLYHNDADFVSAVNAGRGRLNYGALVLGILLAVAGLVVVIVGVITHLPIIGLLGFVAMFAGVLLALRPSKSAVGRPASGPRTAASPSGAASKANLMDRLNERWDKRQDREE
jgi:UPF0716 family protein affecting phage T7 exclusion